MRFSSVRCILLLLTCSINFVLSLYQDGTRRLPTDNFRNKRDVAYSSRIIGGKLANIKDFPYMVYIVNCDNEAASIGSLYECDCGGAIIGQKWILTAAHCPSEGDTEVYVGSDEIYKGTLYHVKKGTRHPKYHPNADILSAYDVMIIELMKDIKYGPKVNAILLGTKTDIVDKKMATIAGFGMIEKTKTLCGITLKNKDNKKMRKVNLPIILRKRCLKIRRMGQIVFESDFCAGYTDGGKGTYYGDSGSPLVINERAIGVLSHGDNESCGSLPEVFVSVPLITPWINSVMEK